MANPTQLKPTVQQKKPDVIETIKKDVKQSKPELGNDFNKEMNSTESRLKTDVTNVVASNVYNNEQLLRNAHLQSLLVGSVYGKLNMLSEKYSSICNKLKGFLRKNAKKPNNEEEKEAVKKTNSLIDGFIKKIEELRNKIESLRKREITLLESIYEKNFKGLCEKENFKPLSLAVFIDIAHKFYETYNKSQNNETTISPEKICESCMDDEHKLYAKIFVNTIVVDKDAKNQLDSIFSELESASKELNEVNSDLNRIISGIKISENVSNHQNDNESNSNSTAPTFKPDWAKK